MKATLEFSLPEQEDEFRAAQDGGRLASAVLAVSERLRGLSKHGSKDSMKVDYAREILREELEERNVMWVLR